MALALRYSTHVPVARIQRSTHATRPIPAPRMLVVSRSEIGTAVGGAWMDLTRLVASHAGQSSPYEELASTIGKDCYLDVGGWRLFLRDLSVDPTMPGVNMATALANCLGPKVNQRLTEDEINDFLKTVPITLGKGKLKVSLAEVMPRRCVQDLAELLSDFARRQ